MAPELVAGPGYGGLIREKPYCAPGQSEPPTLIHLPKLPLSFRDSHYLRVTLPHVLNVMTRRYDWVSPLYL